MMKPCIECGELTVNTEDSPRYDVLNPLFNPDIHAMNLFGPYGPECWVATVTGKEPLMIEAGPTN